MYRGDDDIVRRLQRHNGFAHGRHSLFDRIRKEIDSGSALTRGPVGWHATGCGAEGDQQYATYPGDGQDGGRCSFTSVPAGACRGDACPAKLLERFVEPCSAPVADMIVGQHADIDVGGRENGDIIRVHPVVDALVLRGGRRRDRRLQIDDTQVRRSPVDFLQRLPPEIVERDRPPDRSVSRRGEVDVVLRRLGICLVERRVRRMGKDLVDTAPQHDVAGQQQRNFTAFGHRRSPSTEPALALVGQVGLVPHQDVVEKCRRAGELLGRLVEPSALSANMQRGDFELIHRRVHVEDLDDRVVRDGPCEMADFLCARHGDAP